MQRTKENRYCIYKALIVVEKHRQGSDYESFEYRVKLGANKLEIETEKLFTSFTLMRL